MALPALQRPAKPVLPRRPRLSTGVFTEEELDSFDRLGPDYFPITETRPVSESSWHRLAVTLAFNLLCHFFPDPSDVLIGADQFIFWNRDEKGLVVSADLYVVKGVGRRYRASYKTWEEGGKAPDVVFEFASESTWQNDQDGKKVIYERELKAPEYFLVDATGRYVAERLRGYRLEDGEYRLIDPVDGLLPSEELGLLLLMEGQYLRFLDPRTGLLIPTPAQLEKARRLEVEARERAEAKALAEVEARERAEAKALSEIEARERAEAKAQAEVEARERAEAENARLRVELERLRQLGL